MGLLLLCKYRRADKSLARPGRKQGNVRQNGVNFLRLLALQETKTSQLASRCCWNRARPLHASELVYFLVGLRTYQHRGKWKYSSSFHRQEYRRSAANKGHSNRWKATRAYRHAVLLIAARVTQTNFTAEPNGCCWDRKGQTSNSRRLGESGRQCISLLRALWKMSNISEAT